KNNDSYRPEENKIPQELKDILTSLLVWRPKTFVTLKVLVTAPTFEISNYGKPFHLLVCERKRVASGAFAQTLGGQKHPVAYCSALKHPVTKRKKRCIRTITSAALMAEKRQKIVLGHPLTLLMM
uniref:Uncharacterized protein n=1 Tax=Pavo cristatus TaxID=9049 RepID=A0A8C9FPZ1_PAVCR